MPRDNSVQRVAEVTAALSRPGVEVGEGPHPVLLAAGGVLLLHYTRHGLEAPAVVLGPAPRMGTARAHASRVLTASMLGWKKVVRLFFPVGQFVGARREGVQRVPSES